jgi:hypothetical protein
LSVSLRQFLVSVRAFGAWATRRDVEHPRSAYRAPNGNAIDTFLDRVVLDELIDSKPVREFRWYRGRKHYSGWYWSSTLERLVVYESRLELARIMLADFAPEVIAIAAQPFRLIGADGERIRRHVPDILLVDADGGVTVVDVKAPHKREDPEVKALMRWTARTVALRGWGFEEWYGEQAQLLANVRFLAGYRRRWLIDEYLTQPVRQASALGSSIIDLERSLPDAPSILVRPVVLHLLWIGELVADLSKRLDGLSVVEPRVPEQEALREPSHTPAAGSTPVVRR